MKIQQLEWKLVLSGFLFIIIITQIITIKLKVFKIITIKFSELTLQSI